MKGKYHLSVSKTTKTRPFPVGPADLRGTTQKPLIQAVAFSVDLAFEPDGRCCTTSVMELSSQELGIFIQLMVKAVALGPGGLDSWNPIMKEVVT